MDGVACMLPDSSGKSHLSASMLTCAEWGVSDWHKGTPGEERPARATVLSF